MSPKTSKKPPTRPLTAPSGVNPYGGTIAWNVLGSKLEGKLRQSSSGGLPISTLKNMRKDAQVGLALRLAKAIFYTAQLFIEADDPGEEALLEEVLVNRVLRKLLRTSLLAYDFGFAAHEVVWEVGDVLVTFGPGDGKGTKTFERLFLPHSLREIDPSQVTILRERESFKFAGYEVCQGGDPIVLAPESCFHYPHGSEFGNLYGTSRMEPAYPPWHDYELARFYANVYFERSGAPQLKVSYPEGEESFDEDGAALEDPATHYSDTLSNMMKSSSVLMVPSTTDPVSKTRKWDLEYLKLDARGIEFREWLAYLDVLKMRGCLVPERVATQEKGTGTHGMVESQTRTFFDTADWDLEAWVGEVNDHLIPTFQRLNGLKSKARLKTTGVSRGAEQILLDVFKAITQAETMAASQGLPPEALNDTVAHLVDAERLLHAMEVPIRRERLAPYEMAPEIEKGGASKEEAKKAPEQKPGGLSLAGEPKSLADLDTFYNDLLVEEEADLVKATAPYREGLTAREKAIRAIALLALLHARRETADGKVVQPEEKVRRLGKTKAGEWLPLAKLAEEHDEIVSTAKRVLPSLDGSWLMLEGNRGLVGDAKRRIDRAVRSMLADLSEIKSPVSFLESVAGKAIDDFGKGAASGAWDPGEAGKRIINNWKKREEIDPELVDVIDANRKGFERNVENIGIRTARQLVETVENAFFTQRGLAREPNGILQVILDWRMHPNYTDLTLEAHWRAVYRKAWLALSQASGLRWFRQYHPPITTQGEDAKCRANDGKVLTYEGWQKVAASFGTADALDQFGMHYGCRAFWFPIPAATLAEVAVTNGMVSPS